MERKVTAKDIYNNPLAQDLRIAIFSDEDMIFAYKLLRGERKTKVGAVISLERPTYAENSDFGEIIVEQPPITQKILSKIKYYWDR